MRILASLCLALALTCSTGCFTTPPQTQPDLSQLSATGLADFKKTQIVKELDLLRDTAINANKVGTSLLSDQTTRVVVDFHTSAILVIQASKDGWSAAVAQSLDETLKNIKSDAERALLQPYFDVAKTLLKGFLNGATGRLQPTDRLRDLGATGRDRMVQGSVRDQEPDLAAAH